MEFLKVIKEEVMRFFSSTTLDAILPPIVFVISQNIFDLKTGFIIALAFSLIIAIYRYIKGQKLIYAIAGSVGVGLTGGYALYVGNATSYFLPKLVNGVIGIVVVFSSLFFKRPAAAYLSHLSRGWPLAWFERKDVRPAYFEVSVAWGVLIALRLLILYSLYIKNDVTKLLWLSTLLGTPATVFVLILTFIYGSWRLKTLKGPSVEEFLNNEQPPYSGQSRGF